VSLGLPYWLGYVSAYTEFVGGLMLIVGLLTRFAAALVAINLLVAFFLVGIHQGFGIYNYILALVGLGIMRRSTAPERSPSIERSASPDPAIDRPNGEKAPDTLEALHIWWGVLLLRIGETGTVGISSPADYTQ
jgi:hypothetical protein